MTDQKPPLTEEEIRAIGQRRAEALKRVQELHKKNAREFAEDHKGGKGMKQGPSKGRNFRHQGR